MTTKNPHAQSLARLGASKGGQARASILSPEERQHIARKAAQARWGKGEAMPETTQSGRRPGGKINVAIIGVGNCASSLVQGIQYYREAEGGASIPGLMHPVLGGYHISDINFVAAFDVDKNKVGKDLADAIYAKPNNTIRFADVAKTGIKVLRGMTHDGIGKYLTDVVQKAPGDTVDVAEVLRQTKADVIINYLPVGSEVATKWYMEQALAAKVAVINCVPVFIATGTHWQERFTKANVPIIGDDIKSQVGATITHRVLTRLFRDRGVHLDRTYQLNFGGNTDFLNMLERERLLSKKISKTQSVNSQLETPLPAENIHIGPSDHIPWLLDRKWCYIRMEGRAFGNVPLNIEMKLEVWDSPNSAGVVIDAVRCAKLALDRGIGGPLEAPSSYFMKSPPRQMSDSEAHRAVEDFIKDKPGRPASKPARSKKTR